MVLQLKELFAGGVPRVDFDYELDLSGYEAADGSRPFSEPVHVAGSAVNRAGAVSLEGRADFSWHARCDRCLTPIDMAGSVPLAGLLVAENPVDEPESTQWRREGADELIPCLGDRLDLDELVRSLVVLSLPMKNLCREDCKGLCPVCGHNLNESDCGCER